MWLKEDQKGNEMKGMSGRENDQISEEYLKGREGQCI